MVIVFDLDDTLYPDISFVLSGFKAVAIYLSPLLGLASEDIQKELEQELKVQRSGVFDRFLQRQQKYSKQLVAKCLSIYRQHDPDIQLYPEADACLKRFEGDLLYVVTDGNKWVQKRKFLALGLATRVRKCLCTYAYGLKHSKPSPYCFLKICQWEKVKPEEVVYVADNPYKDFVGIKPLGFQTIRVLTGPYCHVQLTSEYEADRTIKDLSEL